MQKDENNGLIEREIEMKGTLFEIKRNKRRKQDK